MDCSPVRPQPIRPHPQRLFRQVVERSWSLPASGLEPKTSPLTTTPQLCGVVVKGEVLGSRPDASAVGRNIKVETPTNSPSPSAVI
ncbi:hypothetical protein V6N11_080826 [Hibiscus sabdariffa]|uniref:Uncharacterized protein n=1 Tax=Hibiscus sabdariffa TaxID=183260 RepID=A0ABR2QI27_9ROSI